MPNANVYRLQAVLSYLTPDYCPELFLGDTPEGRREARAALREAGCPVADDVDTAEALLAAARAAGAERGFDPERGEYVRAPQKETNMFDATTALGATLDDVLIAPVEANHIPVGAIVWDGAQLYDVVGFVFDGVQARSRRGAELVFRGLVYVVLASR